MTAALQPSAAVVPPASRAIAWCPGGTPVCPVCGQRLYVVVDRNQTMRGLCRNRQKGHRCEQHYGVTGIGGGVVIVFTLSADEFHALATGRKIAGVVPELLTESAR